MPLYGIIIVAIVNAIAMIICHKVDNMEKVILIKGDDSNWFEQAIFVVRKDLPRSKVPVDLVSEAEKIINGYLRNQHTKKQDVVILPKPTAVERKVVRKRSVGSTFDFILNTIILFGSLTLLFIFLWAVL